MSAAVGGSRLTGTWDVYIYMGNVDVTFGRLCVRYCGDRARISGRKVKRIRHQGGSRNPRGMCMSATREAGRRGGQEGIAENVFVVCFRPVFPVKRKVRTAHTTNSGRRDLQTVT